MTHDNYDKQILKQLTRIANALEKIAGKKDDPTNQMVNRYIKDDIEAISEIVKNRNSGDINDRLKYIQLNSFYGMSVEEE